MRRKTDAQFKQEVYSLVGDEYTFLDSYVNAKTRLRVKHLKCGHIYKVTPHNFIDCHNRCPFCNGGIKKTDRQFKDDVYSLVGGEYLFLDPYVNANTKLRVKHTKCEHIYMVTPNNFLRGHRCPFCAGYIKKTNSQFKQEVYSLVGDEYTFLDSYVNAKTKLRVKHNKCGHVYKVTPNDFLTNSRCSYCSGKHKKTNKEFQQEVHDLVKDEYTFLDSYVNAHIKLQVKHNKCGNVYEVAPTEFFSHSTRCPYCNSPKGETIISKILDTLNINYEYQKTFDDLRDTKLLSYDFYIPGQNILIEYQGIQHYQPIDYFGGDKVFKKQRNHDKLKLKYAKTNHYNLITIPYTEDTFSKIKKCLIKHGLTK